MTRRRLIPLLFFVGVACLSLYWQLFHAATHVGDTLPTDYYHFHWNFWWIRHALSTGQSLYLTNYVLTPATTNLAFHTLTPFWFPVWALIEPFFGTMIAMNTIFGLASALTGWVFYLLLHRNGVTQPLALAGGVILQTTPAMLISAWLTNINYLSLFWLPLMLLLWDQLARVADQPRHALVWSVVVGMALYGMMMTDYQFALFLAFLIVPFGVWTLFKRGFRLILYGGIALTVFLTLFWFVGALPYIFAFDRSALSPMSIENAFGIPFPNGYITRLSPYSRAISLGSLVLPGVMLALAVKLLSGQSRNVPPEAQSLQLPEKPVSPLKRAGQPHLWGFLALARPFEGRAMLPTNFGVGGVAHWLWFFLIFPPLILSLGATITIAGTQIQTPYVPFHNLFGGMFRVPARFAPIIIIPAWIFIGQTLSAWRSHHRVPRMAWATALILLVFMDANLFEPMPIRPTPPMYNFYENMGREPYDYAILDVPVAGGSGEAWVGEFPPMETQFYALIHGKRVFNGSVARAPLDSFWSWLYDDPLMAWLGQRRYLEPEVVEQELTERINDIPIGYIVIHQNYMNRSASTIQEIVGYFNQLDDLLCFYTVEGDAIVYRTRWHPDGCPDRSPVSDSGGRTFWIDIGTAGDERHIGWGYHPSETVAGITWRWTGEYPQTDTYVDLVPRDYNLSITMQAFAEPRRVGLLVNDVPVGETVEVTAETLHPYTWSIPAGALGDGHHVKLTLAYDATIVPAEIGQGGDQRRLAVAVDLFTFVPTS